MAKEDFCFTYYDGDAARDKAHMSRLERGGYDDLISAQRKFGHLSIEIIKRVLGSDFAGCWPSIEVIMTKDDQGKYFIEWVENSIEKMRRQAKKQKEKIDGYWKDVNSGKKVRTPKNDTTEIPQYKKNDTVEEPLEDGNGDGYGNENVFEDFGKSENLLIPQMSQVFVKHNPHYPADKEKDYEKLMDIARFLCKVGKLRGSPETHIHKVLEAWEPVSELISKDKFYRTKTLSTISNQIQEIIQKVLHDSPDKKNRNLRSEVSAELKKRFGGGEQNGNQSGFKVA